MPISFMVNMGTPQRLSFRLSGVLEVRKDAIQIEVRGNDEMRERPIIFSTESVRAILAGRKTQTRRVIKNKYGICPECWHNAIPHNREESVLTDITTGEPVPYLKLIYCQHNDRTGGRITCPYGQVGDRLWVKETWYPMERNMTTKPVLVYRADQEDPKSITQWHSSMFMPRRASRITLEITNVKLERLQEITEEDAIAEGITKSDRTGKYLPGSCDYAVWAYTILWDSLNAKRGYGWATNPWVWVISFRKLNGEEPNELSKG